MKKSRIFERKWPVYVIFIYAFIGIFNSFIANEKPILAKGKEGITSPAFNDFAADFGFQSKTAFISNAAAYEWSIGAPIKYTYRFMDAANSGFKSPFQVTQGSRHLLGTDQLGRDVAAGIVRGCFTSMRIGFFGTLLCAFIGIIIGTSSGYFGNNSININYAQLAFLIIGATLIIFYLIFPASPNFVYGLLFLVMLFVGFYFCIKWLRLIKMGSIQFPLDAVIMKIIELRRSIPTLIFILVLFPLFKKPAVENVILILSILGWTSFARHARAETLSIKQREYVIVSKAMGAKFWHICKKHILPNMSATLLVVASANFISNILLESSLSFLGIGLPAEEVSWGNQLNEARRNFYAWWYLLFPGLALFILVYTVNKIADNFSIND